MSSSTPRILKIEKAEFDKFQPARRPTTIMYSDETEWYVDESKTLLGVICLDRADQDWFYVVLGRDEGGKFRGIELEINLESMDHARDALIPKMTALLNTGDRVFRQGKASELRRDLFVPVVPEDKLNPIFRALLKDGYAPARMMIQEVYNSLPKPDTNFLVDFQTVGLDARIWELYLWAVFTEIGLQIEQPFDRPDFLTIRDNDSKAWVEAVVTQPTMGIAEQPANREEEGELTTIKIGSALQAKLSKQYFKLDHVKGQPLFFALSEFHNSQAYRNPGHFLVEYLYGFRMVATNSDGTEFRREDIVEHRFRNRSIRSGFFSEPDATNITGVIWCNSGTVTKFNRMGYYKWLFPKIRMIRHGWYLDTTGEIPTPKPFSHVVGQRTETWSEGVAILYNPNAQRDKKHFVGLSQYWLEDGDVRGYAPQFDALTSVTWISNFESVESAQKFDSLLAEKATEFLEKERNVGPH